MPFHFLNVDLQITSAEPLDGLRDVFAARGDRFFVLYCGPWQDDQFFASFEIYPDNDLLHEIGDADEEPVMRSIPAAEKMAAFCDELEALPEGARRLFDRARRRVFDVGYESGDHCPNLVDTFSCDLLARMAALKIDLVFTVYPQTWADDVSDSNQ